MASAPEDMLKNLLNDPATMDKLQSMMQAFGGTEKKDPPSGALPFGLDNPEMLMKLGKAWNEAMQDDDPRINLIAAIKPYLNEKRLHSADRAMQLLRLSKMSSVLQELHIL